MSFSNIMENILPAMVFSASAYRSGIVSSGASSGALSTRSGATVSSCDRHTAGGAGGGAAAYPAEEPRQWMDSLASAQLVTPGELNRLVLEYLVREGHLEAAAVFCREAKIEADSLQESEPEDEAKRRVEIRAAIEDGRMADAIELVNDAYPELLDLSPELHFQLRRQQLVELIRQGHLSDALQFAQQNLAGLAESNPGLLPDLEECMALLAFEKPADCSFGRWLSLGHRDKLASEVNAAVLAAAAAAAVATYSVGCVNDDGDSGAGGGGSSRSSATPAAAAAAASASASSGLDYHLRLLLWSQDRLAAATVVCPQLADVATARFKEQQQQQRQSTS